MHVLSVVFSHNIMIFHNLLYCLSETEVLEGAGRVVIMCKISEKWKNAPGRLIFELSCESGVHFFRGSQWFFDS
jgi:hypothetical protein